MNHIIQSPATNTSSHDKLEPICVCSDGIMYNGNPDTTALHGPCQRRRKAEPEATHALQSRRDEYLGMPRRHRSCRSSSCAN